MVNKEILVNTLKNNNVDIKNIDLDEIINLYSLCIDYAIEKYRPYGVVNKNKYNFMNVEESACDYDDFRFYNLFVNIIKIKKRGLTKYLDYILMNYLMKAFSTDPINELFKYTDDLLNEVRNGKNGNIPVFFSKNDDIPWEVICSCRYGDIVDSNYVSEDYKTSAHLYNELIQEYYSYGRSSTGTIFDWRRMVNYSYVFFVTNDLFNKEPDRVNQFLEYLKSDIYINIDKMKLYGIDDNNKLTLYMSKLYNEFDQKVKVIK